MLRTFQMSLVAGPFVDVQVYSSKGDLAYTGIYWSAQELIFSW